MPNSIPQCPILMLGKQTMSNSCLRENCGWYSGTNDGGMCSFKDIAFMLNLIVEMMSDEIEDNDDDGENGNHTLRIAPKEEPEEEKPEEAPEEE
jgi:hypothetical protein